MYAQINDGQIFVDRIGKGPPMLVMHGGLGLDHTYFRPWLDRLAESAELIYFDHRGNGRSTRPASMANLSHATWAADADALRAHLGFDKIILFGHSYGGFLAQEYALRFGHNLSGLILCNTAPALDYLPEIIANAALQSTDAPDAGASLADDNAWRALWRRILPMYFKRYDPAIGAAMDAATSYCAAAWNHVNAKCMPTFNTVARLKEITTNALVLGSTADWITPAKQSRRLHAELPNAELVIFEDSGHFPFIEETDTFVATVRDWISKLA